MSEGVVDKFAEVELGDVSSSSMDEEQHPSESEFEHVKDYSTEQVLRHPVSFFGQLVHVYSLKFMVLVFMAQFLLKGWWFLSFFFLFFFFFYKSTGVVYILSTKGMLPLMLALNVPVERAQIFGNAATSPWALKPMTGVLSDSVISFGRRKKYVMLVSSIVGVLGAVLLSAGVTVDLMIVFGMFLLSVQCSTMDLLTEAKYSEIMRSNPETSSAITVFVNGSQRFGYLIAFVSVGLISSGHARVLFGITIAICASVLVPIILNFLDEPVVPRNAGKQSGLLFLSVVLSFPSRYDRVYLVPGRLAKS